jgi:hypothetical protein
MELLLRKLDSLEDMAVSPAFQRVDEGCMLEEESTQLEIGDFCHLHAAQGRMNRKNPTQAYAQAPHNCPVMYAAAL